MAFTAKDVAKLRELTGAGMMDCKKALTQTDGDMEKAAEYLREQGVNIAAKKASRLASEGVVRAFTSKDGLIGALAEVNCESDFVAKSDEFLNLADSIAKQTATTDPVDVETILNEKFTDDASSTITDLINASTAKIGEKLSLRRIVRQSIACGREEAYIHMGGKIGVLLEVETDKDINSNSEFVSLCHDIAMHIAAFSPKYIYNNEVPADEVAHEQEILKTQLLNDEANKKKPENVLNNIVKGRLGKFYKEVCLIDQDFAKDASVTISKLVADASVKFGAKITLKKFTRFVMGEGLEKKCENLADEVAKIQGKV